MGNSYFRRLSQRYWRFMKYSLKLLIASIIAIILLLLPGQSTDQSKDPVVLSSNTVKISPLPTPDFQQASVESVVDIPTPTPNQTPLPKPKTTGIYSSESIKSMLITATTARFGAGQVSDMLILMGKESSLNPYAINKSSGACGLPQAYPCSKMLAIIGSLDNHQGQVDWLMNYVANRYGNFSAAVAHHRQNNWY